MDRTTGMDTVWELVGRHNLRLVLLSDEAVDVSMHCSFYIGIFDADGLLWSDWQRSQYLRAAHANYMGLEQDKDATAASVRTNGIETELINSAEGEVWVRDDGWAARRGRRLRLRLRRRARQHTCMISSPRACITTLRSYTPGARRELSSTDMCTWEI